LIAAAFVGAIGAGLLALRGTPPWSRSGASASAGRTAIFAWGVFFTATGASSGAAARTSGAIGSDAELAGTVVGATFLVMGVPALVIWLWLLVSELRSDEEPPEQWRITDAG